MTALPVTDYHHVVGHSGQERDVDPLRAIIFDLGGTLVNWPDWDEAAPARWSAAFDAAALPDISRDAFVQAMRAAELAHWERVDREHWSGPPTSVVSEGFRRLDRPATEDDLLAVLDGYAQAVNGWAEVYPDAQATLTALRERGYRIGLLSNTWWAAEWHNADLATHGLAGLIDEIVYTSDLPHSKPHPSVFLDVAARLGVPPDQCLMVGDRPRDDIAGALSVGMRAVWKTGGVIADLPADVTPTATINSLNDLLVLIERW